MNHTSTQQGPPRPLAELLEEGQAWPLEESLRFLHRVALQVRALHESGRVHRAIDADSVAVGDQLQPQLAAGPKVRRLGGGDCDPEFCPPELAEGDRFDLPESIEAAAGRLRERGHAMDPRRIDVYQLGTLACRLLSGKSIQAYMYRPKVKGSIPAPARSLLERALGYDAGNRFENCDPLLEALEETLRRVESEPVPSSARVTPPRGSALGPVGDTPPQGHSGPGPPGSAPHGPADLPFERLGHYRILDRVGSGGMGDVYRGYDESLDRTVAIKVLPAELARDEDFVRRFRAEATAAAGLAHPNVVPIFSIDEDSGHHFFAMQYVEGESLAVRLKRSKRLALEETLQIVEQCLAGLEAAHDAGLIHRDIKPANILLDAGTGRALLVDFGLVRRMGQSERLTATGMIMGTVDYIAPEQARGHAVDGRADLYALGVLFYQMLAGRLPFEADTPTAMIFQHAYEAPRPLEEVAPDVPPAISAILAKLMAKAPDDRHQDAREVLAELEAFRQGRPVAASSAGLPGQPMATLAPEPVLPDRLGELAGEGRWRRVRDWAGTMFRRHAPEFVKELQTTTQQVDGAVAEYERRHNRLAKLREEARSVADALSEQLDENARAAAAAMRRVDSAANVAEEQAALAKKHECEENAASLRFQLEQQQQQFEELDFQLSKADATLARLRSQRDVLKARLQAAETGQALEGNRPAGRKRRWAPIAAIACCVVSGMVMLMLVKRPTTLPPAKVDPLPSESGLAAGFGALSGTVFEDLDRDGVRGPDEPGLEGRTIELRRFDGTGTLVSTYRMSARIFGQCITAMGDNVLISASRAPEYGDAGAVALFDSSTGKRLQTYFTGGVRAADRFGISVAVVGDAVLVGAAYDDTQAKDAGAAYLFDASTGELLHTFLNPAPAEGDLFGYCVEALGGNCLVGAPYDDVGAADAGAAYLFDGSTGELLRTFQNPTPADHEIFGSSAGVVGDSVLIGAPHAYEGSVDVGAVYCFDGTTGALLQTYHNPAPASGDCFGHKVAIMGNQVIIAAHLDDAGAQDAGAVYLFSRSSGQLLHAFENPAPAQGDMFGHSIAADGNNVIVGVPYADVQASDVGVAYLFDASNGMLVSTFTNPTPAPEDRFGWSVAALSDKVLISAVQGNRAPTIAGEAYMFEAFPEPSTGVSDSNGSYSFTRLEPGTYSVRTAARDGYTETRPGGAYTIVVGNGKHLSGVDFGSAPGKPKPAGHAAVPGRVSASTTGRPRLGSEASGVGLTLNAEGWIPLPPLVQVGRDTQDAGWKWDGKIAAFSAQKPRAYVSFPLNIDGSYELRARVTITKAKEVTAIWLPIVGDKMAVLGIKGDQGNSESPTATIRLQGLSPAPEAQSDVTVNVGAECALSCRVIVSEEGVDEIEVRRDDQVLFEWSGDFSQVADKRVIHPATVHLETAYYTSSRFRDFRLRMLSGKATPFFSSSATPPKAAAVAGGAEVCRFPELGWGVRSLAFSPDGRFLAAGKMDRALLIFDVPKRARITSQEKLDDLGEVTGVAFTPDGRKLLAGGREGRIQVWDVAAGGVLTKAHAFVGHSQAVRTIAVGDDGRFVASGGDEKKLRYWELETGREQFALDGFEGSVKATYLSPDGKQGLACDGDTLQRIDLEQGRVVGQVKLASQVAQAVAIAPDGSRVVVNDTYALRMWDTATGQEYPKMQDQEIQWVATFTPDGKHLLSGGSGKVNLWEVATGRKVREYKLAGTGYVQTIACSPENLHFAAIPASAGQTLQVFRLPAEIVDQ